MQSPWNFSLYQLVLAFLLALILRFYEMSTWSSPIEKTWMKKFLEKFSNEAFLKSLRSSPTISKKVEPMSMLASDQFSNMTKLEKWQHFLRRRFQELENSYYPVVDNLVQKLADLEEVNRKTLPDLDIHQFSFLKEWQDGQISSKNVLTIIKTMDFDKVAKTQLTRRLDHFIENKQNTRMSDYVIPCRDLILRHSVPIYVRYLNMLRQYFEKLVDVDATQEKVTWIEQIHKPDTSIELKIEDLTLNQVVRRLDTIVIPFNNSKYVVGDNTLCLDEDMAKGARAVHWIFAPKCYIDLLKKNFKVNESMDIVQETEYIKKIIGVYINEKV